MTRISHIHIQNYRALADVELDLGPVNVLFGPNGAGKSTLLDAFMFLRDCILRGVTKASSSRSQAVGMLYDGASTDDQRISIDISTAAVRYTLELAAASGRIEPAAGERLVTPAGETLLERNVGSAQMMFLSPRSERSDPHMLRESYALGLGVYLALNPADEDVYQFEETLRSVSLFHSRTFRLGRLKSFGSEAGPDLGMNRDGANAWAVLRNLHDRKGRDPRFDTIIGYMRRAFPYFESVELMQTGPNSVYANIVETNRSRPVLASGVSDGYLQLLLVLTALFSGGSHDGVVMLDEPEISLHPKALTVLADAIHEASKRKQILVATHSPVLMSQFAREEVVVAGLTGGRATLRRLSEIEDVQDLLDDYSLGSLYMAEVVGAQSPEGSQSPS